MMSSMSSPDSDDPLGIGKKLNRRLQCLQMERNSRLLGNSGSSNNNNNNNNNHHHKYHYHHGHHRATNGSTTISSSTTVTASSSTAVGGCLGRLQPSDRFAHKHVEENIECFLESFKHKTWSVDPASVRGGILDRRPSSDSGDSTGWTSSALSSTDDPSTDSPEYPDDGAAGAVGGCGVAGIRGVGGDGNAIAGGGRRGHSSTSSGGAAARGGGSGWRDKEEGIIAESRRIARWAWRQSRFSESRESPCACSYHPPWSAMEESPVHCRVIDVAPLLQSKYAILSGGKAKNGAPIITFPTRLGQPEVADEDYAKLVTYLCGITPLHETESGVVIVIDRRQDGWGAVKSILLKLSSFFPVHIQVVFLLQPKGFFQRALADFRSKFLKEDLEFKVVLCDDLKEVSEHVDIGQLTLDVGGELEFDPLEWTEHRSAVEKFSKNTTAISNQLSATVKKMEERELPNEIIETEAMIRVCQAERKELLEDMGSAVAHGNILLQCVKGDNERTPLTKLCHVLELQRLLIQLEESETGFGEFWARHESKLKQCLSLRQFEEEFKLVQFTVGRCIETVQEQMSEFGGCVSDVEALISAFEAMENKSQTDLDQAEKMRATGQQLMMEDHYAVDSIRPKCIELQRMCEQYKDLLRRRREILTKSHDLNDRLERANKWCSKGVDLLASQPIDQQQTAQWVSQALGDVQAFMKSSRELKLSNPREFRQVFEDIMTQENRASVQKTLQRMEDVQGMFEKRKETLQAIIDPRHKHTKDNMPAGGHRAHRERPNPKTHRQQQQQQQQQNGVHQHQQQLGNGSATTGAEVKRQPVSLTKSARYRPDAQTTPTSPTNAITTLISPDNSSQASSSNPDKSPSDLPSPLSQQMMTSRSASDISSSSTMSDHTHHSQNSGSHAHNTSCDTSMDSFPESADSLNAKRQRVMMELIETEVTYVNEMHQILQGYYNEMDHKYLQMMIPPPLLGQKHILFGNLPEIYSFHKDFFLQELRNCRDDPSRVGKCFVNRKEEFQMYSIYCQNKPKSEDLRMVVGDDNPFFKDCQDKLGHRLPLGAYLLKPIQRITKYQLLLKEMLRFAGNNSDMGLAVKEALDTMLSVLAYVNDSMHQVNIQGFTEQWSDQGKLLMHGSFRVWTEHKHERLRDKRLRSMQRHVFLYQKSVLLCKKKDEHNNDNPSYTFKNKLKMSQVGLTEKIKGDKRKFELWLRGREEVYIIQAPDMDTKAIWLAEIKRVLLSQFDRLKESRRLPMSTSNDDCHMTSTSRVSSSDSSDVSIDNWRSPEPSKTSTVPVGLEMASPLSPPHRMEEGEGDEEDDEYGEGWSSEFSNTDDETTEQYIPDIEPSYKEHFMALGDYFVVDPTELALKEGDTVEVMRVGKNGWWYAHHLRTDQEGWVPSTYLEPLSRVAPLYSSSDSLGVGARSDMSHSRSPSGGLMYSRGPSPVPETTV